jgi:putative transposase
VGVCRVHFVRNALAKAARADSQMVGAWIRTIFAQATPSAIRAQLDTVADSLHDTHPAIAGMLRDAKADPTAFAAFPQAHWAKTWSTNPIERLKKELKRRTDVVGIFPNPAALLRLSSAVLIEHHDEWQDTDRRYLSEASMQLLFPDPAVPLPAPTQTQERPAAPAELATA